MIKEGPGQLVQFAMRRHGWFACIVLASCSTPSVISDPPERPSAVVAGRCPRQPALDAELPVWDLYVAKEDWDALHVEVRAALTVDALLCLGQDAYPIELELQGASTRRLRKKSFDLKFTEEQPLDAAPFGEREQLPRIFLKAMLADQSLIREALAFELWRMLGGDAPRVGHANLRINGADWGLYALVEPVDEAFFARRGYPADGRLYKGVREEGSRADFRPGRNLRLAFQSKTEGDGEWEDLEALVETLQTTPLSQVAYERDVDPIFPLEAYFDRMIWIAITQNSDAVAQNFYLYNTPRDGHDFWTVLPWDSNISFGADWADHYGLLGSDEQPLVDGGNYLGNRLVQIAGLRRRYLARFRQVLDELLTEDAILEVSRSLSAGVEHDLARDQVRWGREVSPSVAFGALERFVKERPAALHAAIEELEQKYGDEPGGGEPDGEQRDGGSADGDEHGGDTDGGELDGGEADAEPASGDDVLENGAAATDTEP